MMFFFIFQYVDKRVGVYSVSVIVCVCKLNVFRGYNFDIEMEKDLNDRIKRDRCFICQSNDENLIDPSKKKGIYQSIMINFLEVNTFSFSYQKNSSFNRTCIQGN